MDYFTHYREESLPQRLLKNAVTVLNLLQVVCLNETLFILEPIEQSCYRVVDCIDAVPYLVGLFVSLFRVGEHGLENLEPLKPVTSIEEIRLYDVEHHLCRDIDL
jgi:hypothetical protein